jgi:uncharacterized protein
MNISHEPHRFFVSIEGQNAHLDYELYDGVMTITHTVVPEVLGGRGIAAQLTKAAFDHARTKGLKIIPQCSYVAVWVKKHIEEQDLLA